jgi:transposase
MVSKYCDHLPLYRQSGIYAREGVELDRSTLAGWVARPTSCSTRWWRRWAATRWRREAARRRHAGAGAGPGAGKTKTGRLWVYVRDDRPSGSGTSRRRPGSATRRTARASIRRRT